MFNLQRHKARRAAASLSLVVASLCAALALGVSSAGATATGCTFYGHTIHAFVRNASFCATVNGSGIYVNYVTGSFGETIVGLDVLCNVSIKADFYDNSGRWYTYRQGGQMRGCFAYAFNSVPTIPIYSWMRAGYVLVTLQSYGAPIAVIREGIS